MRISDWSSDVCSSDLAAQSRILQAPHHLGHHLFGLVRIGAPPAALVDAFHLAEGDRRLLSVVGGVGHQVAAVIAVIGEGDEALMPAAVMTSQAVPPVVAGHGSFEAARTVLTTARDS